MSGPWKPKIYQGQSLAQQIENTSREKAVEQSLATVETARYQPIAPYGGVPYHNNNSPDRRRSGRACDECRRKKIKCYTTEGSSSCRNCISYRKGCTYTASNKKRGPPRGYINVLEDRLKRIEGLISGMSYGVDQQRQISNPASPTTTAGHNSSEEDDDSTSEVTHRVTSDDDSNKSTASKPPVKVFMDSIRDTHLSPEGRFICGTSVGYLFSRNMKLMDKKELDRLGIELHHDGKSDYFHIKRMGTLDDRRKDQIHQLVDLGVIRSTSAINNIEDWIWKVAGINKALSDRLLKVYFAYIHPLLPVINKVAFLEEYRGIRSCFPAGPLLNAVYGASVRYIENCRKFGDADRLGNGEPWDFPENLSEKLFQNLIIFIKGKYTPCLSTIQAIVIAHNHSANVESWTSGWLLNCIAVRMSQDIGLHRSSEGWNISQQEKETRRMVWWSVYLLDRWFSSGTGRPLTAFDEDCDELYPSENVSVDEIMDTMTEKDQHLPRFPSLDERVAAKASDSFIPMNQPFLHLLKLSEILGRILQGLYTPKAKKHSAEHGSDAIVGYLDDALSKWRASLPPLLEISSAGKRGLSIENHTPLLSMSGLICLSYCTLLILLHRPFIEKENQDTDKMNTKGTTNARKPKLSSQSALTICTSAAIRIIEVSESMHYRDFLMVSWGFALYPVFTAALIHIHNSSNPDIIVSDVAKSNLVRALAVVDKLCLLSPMAASMGNILKKVIAVSSIFVDDPDFVSMVNIRKESMKDDKQHSNTSSSSSEKSGAVNKLNNDGPPVPLPPKKRARSSPETWVPTEDVELLRSHWFPKEDERVNKKRTLDSVSTPTWDDGSWINQLYMPTQLSFDGKDIQNGTTDNTSSVNAPAAIHYTTQQQYQKQYEQNHTNVDVYSIRQFGFNVMNNTGYYPPPNSTMQHSSQNNLSPSLQQHQPFNLPRNASIQHCHNQSRGSSTYSQQPTVDSLSISQQHNNNNNHAMAPLSSSAAIFEFSDFSSTFLYGTSVSNNTLSSINSGELGYNTAPNNTSETSDPSVLFRHRPDNPFWGVPSSMEIEDWHAYLLPQQKQHQH